MSQRKIDDKQLQQLISQGLGVSEIARKLGASKGTVSNRIKALNIAISKDVTLRAAPEIVKKELDTIGQLQKINDNANEILELLMRWNRGDPEALRILECQVRKVIVGTGENAQEVTEYKMKDPRELALKAMAEIRNQLRLQLGDIPGAI